MKVGGAHDLMKKLPALPLKKASISLNSPGGANACASGNSSKGVVDVNVIALTMLRSPSPWRRQQSTQPY